MRGVWQAGKVLTFDQAIAGALSEHADQNLMQT
jgi:hypothetical protein